jgi:DNA helicase IV
MGIRQAGSPDNSDGGRAISVADEQEYVSMLYGLLDEARLRSEKALKDTQRSVGAGGTHQARLERDVSVGEQQRRLAQLNATERGLCFGRTDDTDENTLYIGRIGLRDDDYLLRLIDWRAPAARPFYAATPSDPHGLVRRRHIYTRLRTVTGVDDEVFDLDRLSSEDRRGLSGEALLIATINRARTGRMTDVVATIQAEQDRVIRSALGGVLVVQGGPGTGKTVAALHRAAYLLYTHRTVLERRGVLVIGPNSTFLRYISQVLPSLGETDVVLHTIGSLFPGVVASSSDSSDDPAAVVKGSTQMVRVLRDAIAARQRVPSGDLDIDGIPVRHEICLRIRDRARGLRKPHNIARKLFITEMLNALARSEAVVLDRPLDPEDLPFARERLWDEPSVAAALDDLWPMLTPQRFLADFFTSTSRLELRRTSSDAWTVADVPLLDEAAELLGVDDSAQRRARRRVQQQRRMESQYAQEVLDITGVGDTGMLDAETLAEWNRDNGPSLTTAERAAADRTWTYGHVIIDEAQELSAMAWRMVARRNPTRSMTIVGDVGQTGSPAGAHSWSEMLGSRTRWREERLTVNYRTPEEIMMVAADVLAFAAPGEEPPESVRAEGIPPRAIPAPPAAPGAGGPAPGADKSAFITTIVDVVGGELAEIADGKLAVIAPASRLDQIAAALPAAVPGDRPESLDAQVALLTVTQAKGLEFDRVVLADPAGILDASANGGRDLYVAITRATHRLTVVYEGDLPEPLRRLEANAGNLRGCASRVLSRWGASRRHGAAGPRARSER